MLSLVLPLAYMFGTLLLSSIPATETEETGLGRILVWTPPALQNLLHVPLYAGLGWLWRQAMHTLEVPRLPLTLLPLLIAGAWGVADECYQLAIPGRYFSFLDIALNLCGVVLGVCAHGRYTAHPPSGTAVSV